MVRASDFDGDSLESDIDKLETSGAPSVEEV
jgi:hypothetical protein